MQNKHIINILHWHQEIFLALTLLDNNFEIKIEGNFVFISSNSLIINLININNQLNPADLIDLQFENESKDIKLVHLWEDVWLTKPNQVIARIKSLLGKNIRIHGRKTVVKKVNKLIADGFLIENHLQGTVSSRYKFGLFLNDELIGIATFSALRKMNHTPNYTSAELIRFAIKAGFSVTGGLSKLIRAFKINFKPNDLMTYADCDWSRGEAYSKLGFNKVSYLEPAEFLLNEDFDRSIIKNNCELTHQTVFNTGSLKYILKF